MGEATIASHFVPVLLHYAASRGVDTAALRKRHGLSESSPSLEPVVLSISSIRALSEDVERAVGDPFYALEVSAARPRGTFGILEFALRSAPTVEQALARLVRYSCITLDRTLFSAERARGDYVVSHWIPGSEGGAGRHASEYSLAAIVAGVRELTGVAVSARAVRFIHERPRRVGEYKAFFGTSDLSFDCPKNAVVFDRSVAELPQPAGDPALLQALDRHLGATLPRSDIPGLVGLDRAIADALRDGAPSLATVARQLGMSARTIQRRLRDGGTTFQDTVERARGELAEQYLARDGLSIKEVTFLLGYGHVRAFHRAFARWKGTTPTEYRRGRAHERSR